jgi:voltage-gated potassium channel Kch
MKQIKQYFNRFWSTDYGLTALLILLVLSLFVFYPLHEIRYIDFIINILFSLILLSGVVIVLGQRFLRFLVLGLVVINSICNWMEYFSPSVGLGVLSALLNFLCFSFLVLIVLMQVFKEGRITAQRVQGAIAAYLLFGLMWGFLYQSIALSAADAFRFSTTQPAPSIIALKAEMTYFSFVTLTTLGYGDILAVHPFARMLVIMEALTGQLFPAILLARLVTLEIMDRNDK